MIQTERRKSPRVELDVEESVRLELRHKVHLLDISQSGALVASDVALPVGTRGQLRTDLAARPFSSEVMVTRRHRKTSAGGKAAMGTRFVSMDGRSTEHLDQFLRRAMD
jgi:c-di-GMP-binding flagellar brake protein YcgR